MERERDRFIENLLRACKETAEEAASRQATVERAKESLRGRFEEVWAETRQRDALAWDRPGTRS